MQPMLKTEKTLYMEPNANPGHVEGNEPNLSIQEKEETIMIKSTSETLTCPRCLGPIEAYPDLKLAARSRATKDRDIEICPACGSDEAMRQFHTGVMIPVSQWPVEDPHAFHQPIQDTIDTGEVSA